jgi:hypothetical protein
LTNQSGDKQIAAVTTRLYNPIAINLDKSSEAFVIHINASQANWLATITHGKMVCKVSLFEVRIYRPSQGIWWNLSIAI